MIDNSLPPMGKFYTETKAKEMVLKALEDIKAEIETLNISSMGKLKIGEIIDRKVNEVTHENNISAINT